MPLAAILLVMILAAAGAAAAQQEILEQVVAQVNGDVLTKRQIDERLRITRGLAAETARAAAGDASPLPDATDLLPGILADAVDELLMLQRAGELGIEVTAAEIEGVIAAIQAQSQAATDEAFLSLLTGEGITLAALRDTTRRQILMERVRQQIFRRIAVTDGEARRHFDAHGGDFARPPKVTFHEVVVVIPPVGAGVPTARDAAVARFVAAGDRLLSGMTFDQVARRYSEASSGAGGGLVEAVALDRLDPSVRAALASLRPGEVSGPVRTPAGYCFLRLDGVTGPVVPGFAEARDEVVQRLRTVKEHVALEALLDQLRSSAILQWKRADFAAYYDRRPRYR